MSSSAAVQSPSPQNPSVSDDEEESEYEEIEEEIEVEEEIEEEIEVEEEIEEDFEVEDENEDDDDDDDDESEIGEALTPVRGENQINDAISSKCLLEQINQLKEGRTQ